MHHTATNHTAARLRYASLVPGVHVRSDRRKHRYGLSANARAKVELAIQHAWADSTLGKYGHGLTAFHRFCESENIASSQRLPANEFLLCAFAASRAGEIAGVTARGAIAAVKAWHIVHDEPWQGGARLRYTLKGVDNLTPDSSKRAKRPPVTATMLECLEAGLDPNNPHDAAVFAAASCAFWGQIRLGEILSNAQSTFLRGRIPLASDLLPPSTRAGSRVLQLPHTKTKGAGGDIAMLCRQNGTSDPIRAISNHLHANNIPHDLPIFSHHKPNGDLICLTRKSMLKRCNEVWSRHGYPKRTGHSFRIGGTTELLLAGVSPEVVQAMGRWRSDAFMVYWRRLDLLAPLHAEFLTV